MFMEQKACYFHKMIIISRPVKQELDLSRGD